MLQMSVTYTSYEDLIESIHEQELAEPRPNAADRGLDEAEIAIAREIDRAERKSHVIPAIISVCQRNCAREVWVRRYKPNTRMIRGWLAPRAIRELEMAGNRVTTDHEGRIVINATGQQRLGGC